MSARVTQIKQGLIITSVALSIGALGLIIRPSEKQMGILQMDSYLYEESEQRLLKAYQKNPKDLITLQSLQRIYEIIGRPQEEIRYLKEFIDLRPHDTKVRLELAKVYLWNLEQKLAMDQYLEIVSYEPNNPDVLRLLATSYSWDQQPQKSIDCYKAIAQLGLMNDDDRRALVQLYISTTQLEPALSLMEKLHRQSSEALNIKDYVTLADLYSWTGKPALADSTLNKMLDDLNATWEVRMAYVDWYLNIVRPERALFWLERWSRRPDELQLASHEKLVEVLQAEFLEYEAIASMERLVLHPEANEQHKIHLFWMYIDANQSQKAWDWGTKFSDEVIEKENLIRPLAQIALQLSRFEEAEALLLRILKAHPEDGEAHQSLFSIYHQQNKASQATEQLTWLLQNRGQDPTVLEMAVQYYMKDQRLDEALQFAERGKHLAKDKGRSPFLEAIVQCCVSTEQWNKALEPIQELLQRSPDHYEYGKTYLDILIHLEKYSEGLLALQGLWKEYSQTKDKAYELNLFTGWLGNYKLQFQRWQELENREPLTQFEEPMLESAIQAGEFMWALEVLERRALIMPLDSKDFERLLAVYKGIPQPEHELKLLQGEQASLLLPEMSRLKRMADLNLDLGHSKIGIAILIDIFVRLEPQSEEARLDILKKTLWISDTSYQKEIFQRFGKLDGPDGLVLAELYMQNDETDAALALLENLKPEILTSIKAQELCRNIYIQKGNLNGQLDSLNMLIAIELDEKKNMEWKLEKASILQQMGSTQDAEATALNILESDPASSRAQIILANVYYEQKRYPAAADLILQSGSQNVQDRFLRGACLLRFAAGYSEGIRVFNNLLKDSESQDDFSKWNMVLDIGYELNSPFYIERAWNNIMTRFYNPKLLPRYALHLLYTERRRQAETIFKKLPVTDEPTYLALQKVFAPHHFQGKLSNSEKMALADFSQNSGHWMEALQWLP